jgi:hypothetical protein
MRWADNLVCLGKITNIEHTQFKSEPRKNVTTFEIRRTCEDSIKINQGIVWAYANARGMYVGNK